MLFFHFIEFTDLKIYLHSIYIFYSSLLCVTYAYAHTHTNIRSLFSSFDFIIRLCLNKNIYANLVVFLSKKKIPIKKIWASIKKKRKSVFF